MVGYWKRSITEISTSRVWKISVRIRESNRGVATEIEEIIADPHLVHVEQTPPDLRQTAFGGIARRHEGALGFGTLPLRRRQGAPVDLAVGGQRQLSERDEKCRHHVGGQIFEQEAAQRLERRQFRAG